MAVTAGGTITLNHEAGSYHHVTVDQNFTVAFSNWPTSGVVGSMTLELTQDSTARTPTWSNVDAWVGGFAPDISTNGATYLLTFFTRDAGTTVIGTFIGEVA